MDDNDLRSRVSRTDEDRIIEMMIIEHGQSGAQSKKFEDTDFLPVRQSLYNVETNVPSYDENIFTQIVWIRPNSMYPNPEYFSSVAPQVPYSVTQGTLPDETFLGALMAISAYPHSDLLQNIFASSPEDFRLYGIYTCRFYVEGQWVEVITDTALPCIRNDSTGTFTTSYSCSANSGEFWIALAEKAYAKAVGSYEAIQKVRVSEALLHLTGGSVQQINLHDEISVEGEEAVWRRLAHMDDALLLCSPSHSASHTTTGATTTAENGALVEGQEESKAAFVDEAATAEHGQSSSLNSFQGNKLYSIITMKNFAADRGTRLCLLHDPWSCPGESCWSGPWASGSEEWDSPSGQDILDVIAKDPCIPWSRAQPGGYFWMPFEQFKVHFNTTYLCKLFPNGKFSYFCIPGKWATHEAAGPVSTIRDKKLVVSEAASSREKASIKSTAAVVVDGDGSFFNNPQFRIYAPVPTPTLGASSPSPSKPLVYISLVPLSTDGADGAQLVNLAVTMQPKNHPSGPPPAHLWETATLDIVAVDAPNPFGKIKGAEVSIWALQLDPRYIYHVVPHAVRRGQEGSFITRVFTTGQVVVEHAASIPTQVLSGEWRHSGKGDSEIDTRGGALLHTSIETGVIVSTENSKWCQNPQYHLEILDPYAKEEIYLKIVLRRTDKAPTASTGPGHRASTVGAAQSDVTVGLVVVKADCLEDQQTKKKKGGPRQNAMGEFVAAKPSSLNKKPSAAHNAQDKVASKGSSDKTVLRKISVHPDSYCQQSSFTSRTEATIFYPKIPRSWVPNGLLIIPCLSEKGIKGSYDLEVYCSEQVSIRALPDSFSRSLAGEWTEALAGGSHLSTLTWKRNPKFTLKFKNTSMASAPSSVRLTLTRHGSGWKSAARKDAVGCMVGLYIFVSNQDSGEMQPIYESAFLPNDEMTCQVQLEPLDANSEYVLMPATFAEGKQGAFILSVMADYEFSMIARKH